MIKLFSEKVEPTFTSSDLNILQVENYEEVFFDVLEIEINGTKYVTEKQSSYKGNPVITIPVVVEGKQYNSSFVLHKGEFKVFYNKENGEYTGDDVFEEEESIDLPILQEEIEQDVIELETKENILLELKQAQQQAKEYAERIKVEKIAQAEEDIQQRKQALSNLLKESKAELLEEFHNIVINERSDIELFTKEQVSKHSDKVTRVIDNIVEEKFDGIIASNKKSIKLLQDKLDKHINKLVESCVSTRVDPTLKEHVDNLSTLKDNLDSSITERIESYQNDIQSLEKTFTEEVISLKEKIDKTVNKALSRVGNVKHDVTALESKVDKKLVDIDENIRSYFTEKLDSINTALDELDITDRETIVNLIEESKEEILRSMPEQAKSVLHEKYNPAKGTKDFASDLKKIKKEIEKSIENRFTNEIQSLKRLIELSSGGGSVAKQFADGGTMNGDLVITGSVLASEYLGLSAINVPFDNTLHIDDTHGLVATNVQDAIDELEYKKVNVNDLNTNLMLYPTTASSDLVNHNRLVTTTEDGDYDSVAVDVSTGEITSDGQIVGQLASDTGILNGDVGLINITTIGNVRKTDGNKDATFYFKLFKYDGTTETELCESNPTPAVTTSTYQQFSESALLPVGTIFTSTDRIIIRYYANLDGTGNNPTYDFQFGGGSPVRTLVPVPATTIVKSLWSETVDGDVYYNDGNVGIGTDTPTEKLTVVGNISATGVVYLDSGQRAVASNDVYNIVKLTQAEYDALTPDPATLYIITDENVSSPVIHPIRTVSSNTILDGSSDYTVLFNTTAALTATLPNADAYSGTIFNIKNINTETLTIKTQGGNIDGSPTYIIASQYESATIQSNGTDWYVI